MTDSEYVIQRNRLIPKAEKYADFTVGKKPSLPKKATSRPERLAYDQALEDWGNKWNFVYHQRMNYLAREVGLCG